MRVPSVEVALLQGNPQQRRGCTEPAVAPCRKGPSTHGPRVCVRSERQPTPCHDTAAQHSTAQKRCNTRKHWATEFLATLEQGVRLCGLPA